MSRPDIQSLVSGLRHLPSLPKNYQDLKNELKSPNSSPHRISKIISQDVALTAKILQLANSAYFGIGGTVTTTMQAVNRLGIDTVSALVFAHRIFSQLRGSDISRQRFEQLVGHCLTCGCLAEKIIDAENLRSKATEGAFVAGLLHDVGVLLLTYNLPAEYAHVLACEKSEGISRCEAERHVFGASHDAIGAYLAGLWGLPNPIIEAIAFHHKPLECHQYDVNALTAVHVAEGLLEHQARGGDETSFGDCLDLEYLSKLDVIDRLPSWRALLDADDPSRNFLT